MMDFSFLTDAIAGVSPGTTTQITQNLPQVQQDFHTIAQQMPTFQAQFKEAQGDAETFAYAHLILQALTVAATVGMFIYTVGKEK